MKTYLKKKKHTTIFFLRVMALGAVGAMFRIVSSF